MAKYDVTYKCGHTETVQLYGKIDDRMKKIEWMEQHAVCSECKRKETEEKHRQEYEKALQQSESLPVLQGSEKQVAWAMTIRQKWIDKARQYLESKGMPYQESLEKLLAGYNADREKWDANEERQQPLSELWLLLTAHIETSAKFFIDNRNNI